MGNSILDRFCDRSASRSIKDAAEILGCVLRDRRYASNHHKQSQKATATWAENLLVHLFSLLRLIGQNQKLDHFRGILNRPATTNSHLVNTVANQSVGGQPKKQVFSVLPDLQIDLFASILA
ncbi:MAG TPA: hypothetical protein VF955_02470 [Pyrinomonadaceae bacterium]